MKNHVYKINYSHLFLFRLCMPAFFKYQTFKKNNFNIFTQEQKAFSQSHLLFRLDFSAHQ